MYRFLDFPVNIFYHLASIRREPSDFMNPDLQNRPRPDSNPGMLIIGGFITLAAVLMAYAAFDDITTDDAATFTVEYIILIFCTSWILFVSIILLIKRKLIIGTASFAVLAVVIWGQQTIGPATIAGFKTGHIAMLTSLGWFFCISIFMLIAGFRRLIYYYI